MGPSAHVETRSSQQALSSQFPASSPLLLSCPGQFSPDSDLPPPTFRSPPSRAAQMPRSFLSPPSGHAFLLWASLQWGWFPLAPKLADPSSSFDLFHPGLAFLLSACPRRFPWPFGSPSPGHRKQPWVSQAAQAQGQGPAWDVVQIAARAGRSHSLSATSLSCLPRRRVRAKRDRAETQPETQLQGSSVKRAGKGPQRGHTDMKNK